MKKEDKPNAVEAMKIAIEAVRHAQLCLWDVEKVTGVDFLKWNCETYNLLDLLQAWVKAMED